MLLFINHLATGPGLSSSVAETADPGSLLPLISCAMELGHFGKPPCVSNTLKFKTLWSTPCWGFLLHHCAEVASHMFELAVLAHTSFIRTKMVIHPIHRLWVGDACGLYFYSGPTWWFPCLSADATDAWLWYVCNLPCANRGNWHRLLMCCGPHVLEADYLVICLGHLGAAFGPTYMVAWVWHGTNTRAVSLGRPTTRPGGSHHVAPQNCTIAFWSHGSRTRCLCPTWERFLYSINFLLFSILTTYNRIFKKNCLHEPQVACWISVVLPAGR